MIWQKGHKLQGGRYVIEKVLGEGGFGITYKVLHTALRAYLVIETLNDDLRYEPDFDKYEEKFKQEARILKKLSDQKNKNIVRVTDLFEENKIWYLVMDFVEGESLQDLVKKRKLSETEAVNYIRQVGEALVVCHNKNLFHRDAHPGNIMIQEDGTAILIDFGLAGEIIPSSRYEGFKAFAHPIFAPYEQGYGERKPTIDVYTLAASLYYAVTRNPPARGSERFIQVIFNSQSDPLIPPEQYNPDISNNLKLAIEKGMKLEPQFRPQSMVKWLALLPEMDNSKIVNDDYDYEVAINEDIEEDTTSPTHSIPSRYKRTIKHEFDIVKILGVIFNYLGQGLKVTFFITIDILGNLVNTSGNFLESIFKILGNTLAKISNLPWLALGYITFYYSVMGFFSAHGVLFSAHGVPMVWATAIAGMGFWAGLLIVARIRDRDSRLLILSLLLGLGVWSSSEVFVTGNWNRALVNTGLSLWGFASFGWVYFYIELLESYPWTWVWTWVFAGNTFLLFAVLVGLKYGWIAVFAYTEFCVLYVILNSAFYSVKKELNKQYFSKLHQLLINLTAVSLGLFLGWLAYQFFPVFGMLNLHLDPRILSLIFGK